MHPNNAFVGGKFPQRRCNDEDDDGVFELDLEGSCDDASLSRKRSQRTAVPSLERKFVDRLFATMQKARRSSIYATTCPGQVTTTVTYGLIEPLKIVYGF